MKKMKTTQGKTRCYKTKKDHSKVENSTEYKILEEFTRSKSFEK